MSQEKETLIVKVNENYGKKCLSDKLGRTPGSRKPEGLVEIYEKTEGGNKLISKSNLVVYQGREWIASRIFKKTNLVPQIPHGAEGYNHFIYWFGIGDGGVPQGDPLNPIPPTNSDTGLTSEVSFGQNNTAGILGDQRGSDFYKMSFESVEFDPDPDNDSKYLIAKITINVDTTYAENELLSEAGLFTSPPDSLVDTVGDDTGPFYLFSKVTFPTIAKTGSRQLVFVWYVYT